MPILVAILIGFLGGAETQCLTTKTCVKRDVSKQVSTIVVGK